MYPGIDIIEISRFEKACQRHPRLLQRLFTDAEIRAIQGRRADSAAARFAAKEAVLKALGTGLRGLSWHDIQILSNELGEPVVYLSGKAEAIAKERGSGKIRVSLSHSRDMAAAVAVLE